MSRGNRVNDQSNEIFQGAWTLSPPQSERRVDPSSACVNRKVSESCLLTRAANAARTYKLVAHQLAAEVFHRAVLFSQGAVGVGVGDAQPQHHLHIYLAAR